jgi:ssRNA-specific RNase YbeY (16S rRNA maturation enzyme)
MITVYLHKQSNYPISATVLKKQLKSFFEEHGITSEADVSVSIVGEKKMLDLAKKFLKENGKLHNVLSFPTSEGDKSFVYPPDNILHLGEIIVCYPKAFSEARQEGKAIEERLCHSPETSLSEVKRGIYTNKLIYIDSGSFRLCSG